MTDVIQVDRLGKRYRLGEIGGGRLVDDVNRWMAKWRGKEDPLAKVGPGCHPVHAAARHSAHPNELWALKDVSFRVKEGEALGIIGRNGAGKSTALKILSRITAPTEGEVRVRGRIASLLEVGTGFHSELTGRENIYLNGAILGMTKAEIRRKFDEIVAFSEVEQFIDTPVRRYSSGMYVRLAFAVAAHLEPEILILDEVLAVGDAAFQQKCLGKMKDVTGEGRTIIFVSHNMEAVRRLCTRGIWLRNGQIQRDGEIHSVAQDYFNCLSEEKPVTIGSAASGLSIPRVVLKNGSGEQTSQFRPGEELTVVVDYNADKAIETPYFVLAIRGVNGSCFTANMLLDGHRPDRLVGSGSLACKFASIPLLPQSYSVEMAVRSRNGIDHLLASQEVAFFTVAADLADYGYRGEFQALAGRSTHVVVPYEWQFPDGSVASVSLHRAA